MTQPSLKRVSFSAVDEVTIIEPSCLSASKVEVVAVHSLTRIVVSTCSIIILLLALLLPLDDASNVESSLEGVALFTSTSGASSRPSPRRGKFMGESFDAKDLYEAYKEVETEYHTKAFRDAADWHVLASRNQVEVSMLEHPSDPSCPYVKMVAVIPAPVEECWNWLSLSNWPENMPKMDPFYEGVELHANFDHKGVKMIVARKRTKRILAFGKRDFVFLSVSDQPLSDGTWVSGSVSLETPHFPRQEGYTRAFQDSIAFYKPLDRNTKTRVTIVCRIDLNDSTAEGSGGWIPMWIYVKTIGTTGVRSVTSMRDQITKEHKENKHLYRHPAEEKGARFRFKFWKDMILEKSTNRYSFTDEAASQEIPGVKPAEGKRWRFPWVHKASNPPMVSDNNTSRRIPRFFRQ